MADTKGLAVLRELTALAHTLGLDSDDHRIQWSDACDALEVKYRAAPDTIDELVRSGLADLAEEEDHGREDRKAALAWLRDILHKDQPRPAQGAHVTTDEAARGYTRCDCGPDKP